MSKPTFYYRVLENLYEKIFDQFFQYQNLFQSIEKIFFDVKIFHEMLKLFLSLNLIILKVIQINICMYVSKQKKYAFFPISKNKKKHTQDK